MNSEVTSESLKQQQKDKVPGEFGLMSSHQVHENYGILSPPKEPSFVRQNLYF
jgi:hypothetical protein